MKWENSVFINKIKGIIILLIMVCVFIVFLTVQLSQPAIIGELPCISEKGYIEVSTTWVYNNQPIVIRFHNLTNGFYRCCYPNSCVFWNDTKESIVVLIEEPVIDRDFYPISLDRFNEVTERFDLLDYLLIEIGG